MLPSHVLQLLFLVYLLVIFQKKKSRKKINPVVLATSFFKNVGCGVERAINALYTTWVTSTLSHHHCKACIWV